ncbi:TAXI family TRAP transporter solute-binding subunit [Nonomuraea sp. NPDC046570]|uniref:TAXI family TRAP transporter solute-binding subunit n=1 Tax=Nonomuraea sp. NPDC046570 TaxID=3155255 RepID=UPI0033EFA60A
MRRAGAVAVTIAILLVCAGCAGRSMNRLVIATGGLGGVYNRLGHTLAEEMERRWNIPIEERITGASLDNLELVAAGKADVGFTTIDAAALAASGQAPFTSPSPVVALMRLYDEYLQVVVSRSESVKTLADLRGRTISVGSEGSGTELLALRLLDLIGLSPGEVTLVRLGVAESAEALRSRKIQAFFFTSGLPAPAISELSRSMPIRLVPTDRYLDQLQERYDNVYLRRSIPSGTYGSTVETPTIGVANILVVNSAMTKIAAYDLTRMVFSLRDVLATTHVAARYLHESSAIKTLPIELHPGAVRFYREAKTAVTAG